MIGCSRTWIVLKCTPFFGRLLRCLLLEEVEDRLLDDDEVDDETFSLYDEDNDDDDTVRLPCCGCCFLRQLFNGRWVGLVLLLALLLLEDVSAVKLVLDFSDDDDEIDILEEEESFGFQCGKTSFRIPASLSPNIDLRWSFEN